MWTRSVSSLLRLYNAAANTSRFRALLVQHRQKGGPSARMVLFLFGPNDQVRRVLESHIPGWLRVSQAAQQRLPRFS
jgi:hypothetical protein